MNRAITPKAVEMQCRATHGVCAKFSAMLGDLLLNCSMFRDAGGEGWWHLLSRWVLLPTNPRQPSSLLCQGDLLAVSSAEGAK